MRSSSEGSDKSLTALASTAKLIDIRARLASLYSDFRVQRATNPDGYTANVAAWQDALEHAARAGVIPASGGGKSILSLSTDEKLIRALESKEWGRPLALGTVIVGNGTPCSA